MTQACLRRHAPSALIVVGACLPAFAANAADHKASNASAVATKPQKSLATSASFSYSIEPAPAWVVPARERQDAPAMTAPLHYRVIDEQTRLDDKTAVAYSHVVRVVGDTSGLGQASQIELEFDPSFQSLAFHHVEVVRDGKRTTRLDRKKIQLLQRETQLERRVYDGRVTASIVLDDVRVGDQIDFAYSVRGANPVFAGRFVSLEWMSSHRGPVALYQYRLIAPEARKIQYRVGSPEIQGVSKLDRGVRETVFRRESIAQLHADNGAPYGVILKQQVQFSEYADWADVARWGVGLFAPAAGDGAAIDRQAAEIKAQSGEPEKQLVAALHFVQADVRYFGTEIGPNSHKPALPDKVIEQRFGDCKDKVSLLIALLRRLDIPAAPVLVSTALRGHVDEMLPSPLAFDHVIARVELKGRSYFLDATRGHQTGELENRQSVGLDKGLLLASDTTSLLALPSAADTQRMHASDSEARNTRARASSFSRDYAAAKSDLDELLRDRSQVRRGYPLVWLALSSRNDETDASKVGADITDDQLPADWPRPLVDWARAKTSADAVIASAKSGGSSAERLCEAYFYIGERYLAEGDTARAREFFQKSVDQGVTELIEDGSSRIRLASLKR